MNITVIYTTEYVYNNIKLNKTRNIVEKTIEEYQSKYGYNYYRKVNVKCNVNFFDKKENKMKDIMIECYNFIGEVDQIMQTSKGMLKFIRIIELKIIIEGVKNENVLNLHLKSENIPIIWKKIFIKFTNNRNNQFIQGRRERLFYNIQ